MVDHAKESRLQELRYNRMDVIWLRVLGITLEVRCLHERCYAELLEFMGSMVLPAKSRSTPDWRLEISFEAFDRYLHRERPAELEGTPLVGVKYARPGDRTYIDWTSRLPPLIPFHHPASRGRFVGLHAACLSIEGLGCVVLPGDRGAGKTTISTLLCYSHSASLLTDESTFLHRRTKVVEPLALAMGIHTLGPDRSKELVAARRMCGSLALTPGPVACICLLARSGGGSSVSQVSETEALRSLIRHQLDVGCSWDEAIATLAPLCTEVPAYRIAWAKFEDIPELVDKFIKAVGIGKVE